MNKGFLGSIVILCGLLSAVFLNLGGGYDTNALLIGNFIMALLCFASYFIMAKQISARPQAFVRSVSGSSYLKIFVCLVGILAYALIKKPNAHKPTIFMLMGIYAAYTIIETIFVQRLARKTK